MEVEVRLYESWRARANTHGPYVSYRRSCCQTQAPQPEVRAVALKCSLLGQAPRHRRTAALSTVAQSTACEARSIAPSHWTAPPINCKLQVLPSRVSTSHSNHHGHPRPRRRHHTKPTTLPRPQPIRPQRWRLKRTTPFFGPRTPSSPASVAPSTVVEPVS